MTDEQQPIKIESDYFKINKTQTYILCGVIFLVVIFLYGISAYDSSHTRYVDAKLVTPMINSLTNETFIGIVIEKDDALKEYKKLCINNWGEVANGNY